MKEDYNFDTRLGVDTLPDKCLTLRDAFIALIVERSVNWLAPTALPYAWTAILAWLTLDVLRWAISEPHCSCIFKSEPK